MLNCQILKIFFISLIIIEVSLYLEAPKSKMEISISTSTKEGFTLIEHYLSTREFLVSKETPTSGLAVPLQRDFRTKELRDDIVLFWNKIRNKITLLLKKSQRFSHLSDSKLSKCQDPIKCIINHPLKKMDTIKDINYLKLHSELTEEISGTYMYSQYIRINYTALLNNIDELAYLMIKEREKSPLEITSKKHLFAFFYAAIITFILINRKKVLNIED